MTKKAAWVKAGRGDGVHSAQDASLRVAGTREMLVSFTFMESGPENERKEKNYWKGKTFSFIKCHGHLERRLLNSIT